MSASAPASTAARGLTIERRSARRRSSFHEASLGLAETSASAAESGLVSMRRMSADASPWGLQTASVTAPSVSAAGTSAGRCSIGSPLSIASARAPIMRSVSSTGPWPISRAAIS